MQVLKEYYLNKWEDFVTLFENYNSEDKKYIFRGHSNKRIYPNKFEKWDIVSSFNRIQEYDGYSFSNYLYQQFESSLFKDTYSGYQYEKITELTKASLLQKCYFFQHYGIPTCFIDFTFDPLIALYFSLSTISGRNGGSYDGEGNPTFFSNDSDRDFISIYQIDVNVLQDEFNIESINSEMFDLSNIGNYHVGLDLNPTSQGESLIDNFNLLHQKGCFLYYDNEDFKLPFEKFLEFYCLNNNIKLRRPAINVYNINYNSLYKKRPENHPNQVTVFNYLRQHNISGQFLFNDIQGLKYDFNFFHNE
jgi:hypothetical protein